MTQSSWYPGHRWSPSPWSWGSACPLWSPERMTSQGRDAEGPNVILKLPEPLPARFQPLFTQHQNGHDTESS
jgi:hypothetical protein